MVSILRQLMLKLAQKRGMVAKADRELEIENPTPPVRARIQKKRMKDQQEVERLEQEIRDKVGPDGKLPEGFNQGGGAFRDPVMEERGYAFDPERNQYFEEISVREAIEENPELANIFEGSDQLTIRSYFSPRDDSSVPVLSDARREAESLELLDKKLTRQYKGTGGKPRKKSFRVGDTISMADVFSKEEIMDMARGRSFSELESERLAREERSREMAIKDAEAQMREAAGRRKKVPFFIQYTDEPRVTIVPIDKADGGMVNNTRQPAISRGLSGLLSSYTSGPLARMSVPRGTPQGMFRGGAPGMRDVGFRGPQRIPDIDIDQSAISAALANIPAAPAAQTNVAIQSPAERLATTTAPTRTAATPVGQTLKGQRPTDFLGFATTEGVAEGQTPFEPGMLLYEGTDVLQSPTGPTAEEIAAQQAAEEAAAQAAAEEAAEEAAAQAAAEQLAVEQAAADQAAQQLAEEQLAAEQLAAQKLAAEQLAAQKLAAEQLAEQLAAQEAAEAARQQELLAQQEAQRIAQEQFDAQVAAEQAAAQQTAAEVLAQEQAAAQAAQTQTQETRVESASDKIDEANQKQVVADVANQNLAQATNQGADSATIETLTLDATLKQQDADAAALEAELAVAPDPTPIYEAPTQGELLQAAADADTGPLFTTPTDLGTVVPRSTLGLVPQTTGIMSFLGQPNFNVSDSITDYTSGYPSSQDMQFRRTFYPFQQVTEEEAQNQYMADIFKPVADMSQFRPALTFGERQQTREKGSASDRSETPTGDLNTGAPASAPGDYGLDSNQMYQCPNNYVLAFENGRPICKSTKGPGGPGGRQDVEPEIVELGRGS